MAPAKAVAKRVGLCLWGCTVRRAARVDANQGEIVEAMKAAGATVWVLGLPVDLLVGAGGKTALAEVKVLVGKKDPKPAPYTRLQQDFMLYWRGGEIVTLTTVDEGLALVKAMRATNSIDVQEV